MSRIGEWLFIAAWVLLHIITLPFFVIAAIIDRVKNGEPR